MADAAEMAFEIQLEHVARGVMAAARAPLPAGVAGNCADCGDASLRLVDGLCAPCREPFPRIPRRF